jgi:thioesterase domain-containing protein
MPATELCVIHPGALSASCWARLASHLPAGTPVKVLELETVNRFWASDPSLTIDALAERLRGRLGASRAPRVLVGWGVGGVVADALAAPARRVVLLDAPAPGAVETEPSEAQRLRSFAMYIGARKGLTVRPQQLTLDGIREAAIAVGALRGDSAPASVERCFEEHCARVLRDHRLTADHAPSGTPLTVVKAADSLVPDGSALGWDRFGPVERLGSAGDHYSMLTDPSAAAHLAMLLRRWLAPAFSSAA